MLVADGNHRHDYGNFLHVLPGELMQVVFQFLPFASLLTSALPTCRQWHDQVHEIIECLRAPFVGHWHLDVAEVTSHLHLRKEGTYTYSSDECRVKQEHVDDLLGMVLGSWETKSESSGHWVPCDACGNDLLVLLKGHGWRFGTDVMGEKNVEESDWNHVEVICLTLWAQGDSFDPYE